MLWEAPLMRFGRPMLLLALLPAWAAVLRAPGVRAADEPQPKTARAFEPLPTDALHNAYQVTDKVLSGAAPEGEASFAALRDLGVKTVISVDGAKPDVATAKKYGLRYVHLPIGYDDVTPDEGRAIARAIDELPGPIYVHCHHGKHRSAAAVATACVINGRLKPGQADSVLRTFGTGLNYKGLWASARGARPLAAPELAAVKVDYRETAPIPPLAEAMVKIDETLERLKLAQKSNWQKPPTHPDVDPPHEALQLVEHLREMARTPDTLARPEAYRVMLSRGEAGAQALHESLTAWSRAGRHNPPPASVAASMKVVGASCTDCHKAFRD